MEKSQLLQLIFSFSPLEKKEVRKFLNSPYFNHRQDVLRLFDRLCGQERPDKAAVKQHLFGDESADDQELRLRMTYLHRLLEHYLAQKETESDALAMPLHLARAYRKRGMEAQFERAGRSMDKKQAEYPQRDVRYYERQYQLSWERHQVSHTRNPTDLSHLKTASQAADVAYIALKLRLICLRMVHQTLYTADAVQAEWEAEVLAYAASHFAQAHPAVAIYLHCYHMMRFPEQEEHFRALKQALLADTSTFSAEEMHALLIWAVNYCVRRLNAGDKTFYLELFDLYKSGLESGYLLENGILPRFTYYNVVAVGLQTGHLDWVSFFIQEYKNSLEKQYRESAFSFNLARLEFAKKQYGAVLELLQKANYRDVLVNLAIKTLLLKTYYELGEYELLQSHLDAMQNYLNRKSILGYHKSSYLTLIRYVARLLSLSPSDKSEAEKLRVLVEKEAQLLERDWFLGHLAGR